MHALGAASSMPSSQGQRSREGRLCTCRWVGCCRVLPVPAPSKGCAAFCIFSSHCHSNRLGAWVPALPAPASRSHPAHSPCLGAPGLPARHSQARTAQRGAWGALALGSGCLQHRASFPSQGPSQAHPRGLGGPGQLCHLLSHQKIMSAETSSW